MNFRVGVPGQPPWISEATLLYQSGLTLAQVAARVGAGSTSVRVALKKHGVPSRSSGYRSKVATTEERFWASVDKSGDCWLWIGSKNHGHGQFDVDPKVRPKARVQAHRYSYELLVGPIPDGLVLDHRCRVRNCVRPAHLRPVTSVDNTLAEGSLSPSAINANKIHCVQGHEFTPENTYQRVDGWRACRECKRESDRSRRRQAGAGIGQGFRSDLYRSERSAALKREARTG